MGRLHHRGNVCYNTGKNLLGLGRFGSLQFNHEESRDGGSDCQRVLVEMSCHGVDVMCEACPVLSVKQRFICK